MLKCYQSNNDSLISRNWCDQPSPELDLLRETTLNAIKSDLPIKALSRIEAIRQNYQKNQKLKELTAKEARKKAEFLNILLG